MVLCQTVAETYPNDWSNKVPEGHWKYILTAQLKKPLQPHGVSAKRPGPLSLQKSTAAASREALSHVPVGAGGGGLDDSEGGGDDGAGAGETVGGLNVGGLGEWGGEGEFRGASGGGEAEGEGGGRGGKGLLGGCGEGIGGGRGGEGGGGGAVVAQGWLHMTEHSVPSAPTDTSLGGYWVQGARSNSECVNGVVDWLAPGARQSAVMYLYVIL